MQKAKGATPKKSPNTLSFLAAMLVGVVLTLGIGLFIYLWNPFKSDAGQTDAAAAPMVQPKVNVASEPNHYEFYDLLKQQQVSGLPEDVLASRTAATEVKPDVVVTAPTSADTVAPGLAGVDTPPMPDTQTPSLGATPAVSDITLDDDKKQTHQTYILQINSFDNADDADKRRVEVLMAGVDAQIVKRRLASGGSVYQVISQPMPSAEIAADAQHRLQSSGIDSLIVEQRH